MVRVRGSGPLPQILVCAGGRTSYALSAGAPDALRLVPTWGAPAALHGQQAGPACRQPRPCAGAVPTRAPACGELCYAKRGRSARGAQAVLHEVLEDAIHVAQLVHPAGPLRVGPGARQAPWQGPGRQHRLREGAGGASRLSKAVSLDQRT